MSADAVSPRAVAGQVGELLVELREWIQSVPTARWFWMLWAFIGVVSVFDAWLVLVNQSEMLFVEENLLCYTLIKLDPHGLSYFLPAKGAGTLLVLAILRAVYARIERYGMAITSGVAFYQFGLLFYFLL
jgi:hypothetical protein